MMDKLLEKYNLKYEDLTPVEKETLNTWMDALSKGALSMEKVRLYVKRMREEVEMKLTAVDHEVKEDLFLKARLRNYLLIEAFLETPERAKEQIERAIASFATNIK